MKTTSQQGRLALLWGCAAILGMQLTASAQTLVNRYNFTTDATGTNVVDLVGGPAWYGTIPNGGDFTTVPGQLILAAAQNQFVQLPAGVLSNYAAVTIDCWATFGTLPNNCFLYGFGNTDAGGAGENYIFCQPQNGRIAISGVDPGWQGEQGTGGAGDFSGQTVHVTSVFNPAAGYLELYKNGVLVSRNSAITVQMSSVSNQLNYIARSLYTGDSYMDIELDEFRIWNGALNSLQVGGCEVNGPDNPSYNGYGSVTSIGLQIPFYQLVQGTHESAAVTAQASGLSYPVDITLLANYSSSNPNILTVTNNNIYAVGQGSASIIATYGSLSSTQTITVIQPASTLAHRYSFTADASDSVGGAAWNGTLPNGGTFAGNQVSLLASGSQYVQFPAGIISNYNAVTIEAWATFPSALPGNCFFFGFGNTDGGGAGENYIYLQPSAGHIGITGSDPGWQGPENTAGTYGNLSTHTNIHLAAVFNPAASTIAVYTNGVLAGKNTASTWQLNQVSSVLNYIARSLYTGDSYMDVNVDEFRIYNGALTSQGVAISDQAGPNSIPSGVTNGPGALLSLTLQAPSVIETPLTAQLKLLANYTSLTNWDIIGNSIYPPVGLKITSSDPNVLWTDSDNVLHSQNPGVATVTVTYQGTTNTATITVIQSAATPSLVHRYSFGDANGGTTVADSVGGPTWNGTVMSSGTAAIPAGGAFTNGVLWLSAANTNFVQLPAGILSNYSAVSLDTWVTFTTPPSGNCMLWSFGATDPNFLSGGAPSGYNAIFLQPVNANVNISSNDPTWYGTESTPNTGNLGTAVGGEVHVTAVFDPPAHYLAMYTNGVLAAINAGETVPMNQVSNLVSYLARSVYWADGYFNSQWDEFRIYNGVLSPADVAASQAIGPNQVLTTNVTMTATSSGGNLVLTWPAAASGFTLQSRSSLVSGSWTTVTPSATLAGGSWQTTVPKIGGTQFFRLVR